MRPLAVILLAAALALAPAAEARPHAKHHSKKSFTVRKAKKVKARADRLSAVLWPVSTPAPRPGQPPANGLCRVLYVAPDGSLELFDCR